MTIPVNITAEPSASDSQEVELDDISKPQKLITQSLLGEGDLSEQECESEQQIELNQAQLDNLDGYCCRNPACFKWLNVVCFIYSIPVIIALPIGMILENNPNDCYLIVYSILQFIFFSLIFSVNLFCLLWSPICGKKHINLSELEFVFNIF